MGGFGTCQRYQNTSGGPCGDVSPADCLKHLIAQRFDQGQSSGHPAHIMTNTTCNLTGSAPESLLDIPNDPSLFYGLPLTFPAPREQLKQRGHFAVSTDCRSYYVSSQVSQGSHPQIPINEDRYTPFHDDDHRRDLPVSVHGGDHHVQDFGSGNTGVRVPKLQA